MNRAVLAFVLFLIPFSLAPAPASAQDDKVSPFSMVRWKGETPEVQVDGSWYGLVSIDGVKTETILAHCKSAYGDRWAKRFCEDLVEVLSTMGHAPEATVALVLTDLRSGKRVTAPRVVMTEENRQTIRDAQPRPDKVVPRVEKRPDRWIPAPEAAADLDQLEWLLENELSYFGRLSFDHRAALDAIRAGLGDGIDGEDFHVQLRKLVGLFGDGHSRVAGVLGALLGGFAPCRFADVQGDIVALEPGKPEPLEAGYPWVTAIDGVPVEKWLAEASHLAAQGSPQLVRADAVRYLSFVRHLRHDLSLPQRSDVELTLASASGKRTKIRRPLADRPAFAEVPLPETSRTLEGGIGYLRIPSMSLSASEVRSLVEQMEGFLDAPALVLDVRGNGGGSRDALLALFPYFMEKDDPPHVVNVAARLLEPGIDAAASDLLANRFLYPRDDGRLGAAEKASIDRVARVFRPEWRLPEGRFSDWHYLVISPRESGPTYKGRVALLIDSGCFSATDIFVSAFSGRRNVTLVGTPTSGGSGRSQNHRLENSGLTVRLSTMASFRADGRLYDGKGIAPDVEAAPTLEDFLGRGDSVLEKALEVLRGEG
jgi:hypothetical protein